METKKSKYDTNPLDPDVERKADESWGGGNPTQQVGRVAGTPCFRDGKLVRLDQWLAGLGRRMAYFESSTCYSDSHNDLPLLQRVSRPVAVDPDPTLAREAERRGWERISLR